MKIQIYQGKFDGTCTVSSNLTANQAKSPVIRDVIQYSEPRMLSTLIVSGVISPWDLQVGRTDVKKTKIGTVPSDKLIGDNAYRYQIQGRIQSESIVVSQVGSTLADGTFQLIMKDDLITPGMVTTFYTGSDFQARSQGLPSGGQGAFLYTFKSVDGALFDWNVHVAPQPGEKTAFGQFNASSERSLRGYGRSFYPDMFINHLNIQRKTIAISGGALTDITWAHFNSKKGWFFTKERQSRIQFMLEDEWAKIFAKSTMKDANGDLLAKSWLQDPETGEDVIIGDGMLEQIKGGNELFGSGTDGFATIEDHIDMGTELEKQSNSIYGNIWYVVSGTDGYQKAQEVLRDYWLNRLGGRSNASNTGSSAIGGDDIVVGGNFDTFNFAGNQYVFVKHPMFDDAKKFPKRSSDGKLIQSGMYIYVDMGINDKGQQNMEILSKGAYGINRSMVSAYLNGLTGDGSDVVSSVDAKEFNMLKEDGLFIYNTKSCGIIHKSNV